MKQPKEKKTSDVKTVDDLRKELKKKSSPWSIDPELVKEENLTDLPHKYSLGCKITKLDDVKDQPNHQENPIFLRVAKRLPSSWDWRNVEGRNFVTPARDQRSCESCVAFACIASIESNWLIQSNRDVTQSSIDLSESSLFFTAGRSCSVGWKIKSALEFALNQGICSETEYPYRDINQDAVISKGGHYTVRISGYYSTSNKETMKLWLVNKGPIVANFTVYNDFFTFFNYSRDTYKHVTGKKEGSHAVCVIGYDDNRKAWLCKNSWGTNQAHPDGCFWISYGDCSIDDVMFIPTGISYHDNYDRLSYNPSNLKIEKRSDGTYLLTDGRSAMRLFDNLEDAKNGLAVAKRHNKQCFVGRDISRSNSKRKDFIFEYWEGDSGIPRTALTKTDIIRYNPNKVEAFYDTKGKYWSIREDIGNGRYSYLFTAIDMDDAMVILEIVKKYTKVGFIGRSNRRKNRKDYIMNYFE